MQDIEQLQVCKYLQGEEDKQELATMVTTCLTGIAASDKANKHAASSSVLPLARKEADKSKPKSSDELHRIMSFFG